MLLKSLLTTVLVDALQSLQGQLLNEPVDSSWITLERSRDPAHGDFACNIALRLAKSARRDPRDLAQAIIAALRPHPALLKTEVAGAGFINFFLAKEVALTELQRVHTLGAAYGRVPAGQGEKIILEFVSANPTGPMHVGHGRQAAYGAALANLLEAAGHQVFREYYINDAGRQMDILAVSVWLRYLELGGETLVLPQNAYRADYLLPVARALREQRGASLQHAANTVFAGLPEDAPQGDKEVYIDAVIQRCRELIGTQNFAAILQLSRDAMLSDIRDDLEGFGVRFDAWYSEHALGESGAIDHAIDKLRTQGSIYEKDGALWFRATAFGDDEDRVVVRENGVKTYFASDIAYHLQKRERGFQRLIDVLGADHHGYVARVRGGLTAMGEPGDSLEVCLIQLVSLYRGGVKLSMGKREGHFVTLRQLREEVGNDACRLFYLMRSNDQPLDFDLELATSKTNDNPAFYIQYAHARVASVIKEAAARGLTYDAQAGSRAAMNEAGAALGGDTAQAMISSLARYAEVLAQAAENRAPHALAHYLRELANTLHTYYNAERLLVDDAATRNARLWLLLAVQQVIRNGLAILGVTAPESM